MSALPHAAHDQATPAPRFTRVVVRSVSRVLFVSGTGDVAPVVRELKIFPVLAATISPTLDMFDRHEERVGSSPSLATNIVRRIHGWLAAPATVIAAALNEARNTHLSVILVLRERARPWLSILPMRDASKVNHAGRYKHDHAPNIAAVAHAAKHLTSDMSARHEARIKAAIDKTE